MRISALVIATLSVIFACKSRDHKGSLKITNGLDASQEEFPAVTKVYSAATVNGPGGGSCTASWVSPSTLLTAAHCLIAEGGGTERVWVLHPKTGETVEAPVGSVIPHPSYRPSGSSMQGIFDIALVRFPKAVSENYLSVPHSPPPVGEKVTIVGFGGSHFAGSDGAKRYGQSKIAAIDGSSRQQDGSSIRSAPDVLVLGDSLINSQDTMSSSMSNSVNAANVQGDSGGPALFSGKVVGVASTVDNNRAGVLAGSYCSTTHHRDWMKSTGFDICGVSRECPNLPSSNDAARQASGSSQPNSPDRVDTQSPSNDHDGSSIPSGQTPQTTGTEAPSIALPPKLLDCNSQFASIRAGGSGICLNSSSGNCYRYGNGNVLYDAGAVSCQAVGTGGTSEVVSNSKDCNADYSQIRKGGTGICINRSSGNCYRFAGGNVLYERGRVACP